MSSHRPPLARYTGDDGCMIEITPFSGMVAFTAYDEKRNPGCGAELYYSDVADMIKFLFGLISDDEKAKKQLDKLVDEA